MAWVGAEMKMTKISIRTYRDLIVWQRAMELARIMYRETGQMPAEERLGLVQQMRRAAVSVASNIAEGYARQGRADYIRFLKTARGSLAEVSTQYELAQSLGLLSSSQEVQRLLEETERVLQGLLTSLNKPKLPNP